MRARLKNLLALARNARAAALAGAMLLASHSAHADMWIYTDNLGVKHFASSQVDKRYALLFRGTPAPDAGDAQGNGGAQMNAGVTNAAASARSKVAVEISPGFLAVKQHLRTAADANQLDMALLQAVIHTESGFNPSAVSPKGAVGLMQVMPATAQRYGVANDRSGTVSVKLTDPKTNIQAGARYLRDLINMFPGQLELAVAAYNAGEGAVQKAGNKIPNFKETQNYVRSVMQLYQRLSPQAHVAPVANSGTRVQAQFLSPDANINLRWGELASQQDALNQANKTGRGPLQPLDLAAVSGEIARARQALTD